MNRPSYTPFLFALSVLLFSISIGLLVSSYVNCHAALTAFEKHNSRLSDHLFEYRAFITLNCLSILYLAIKNVPAIFSFCIWPLTFFPSLLVITFSEKHMNFEDLPRILEMSITPILLCSILTYLFHFGHITWLLNKVRA